MRNSPILPKFLAVKTTQIRLIWQSDEVKNFLKMFFLNRNEKNSPVSKSRAKAEGRGTRPRSAPDTPQHSWVQKNAVTAPASQPLQEN